MVKKGPGTRLAETKNIVIGKKVPRTRVDLEWSAGWSCYCEILQFGNACWSFFTPASVIVLPWSHSP